MPDVFIRSFREDKTGLMPGYKYSFFGEAGAWVSHALYIFSFMDAMAMQGSVR